jgi:hypothetical protein
MNAEGTRLSGDVRILASDRAASGDQDHPDRSRDLPSRVPRHRASTLGVASRFIRHTVFAKALVARREA